MMPQKTLYYFCSLVPILLVIIITFLDILERMSRMSLSPEDAENGSGWIMGAVGSMTVLIVVFLIFSFLRKKVVHRTRLIIYALLFGIGGSAALLLTGPDLGVITLMIAIPIWLMVLAVITPLNSQA